MSINMQVFQSNVSLLRANGSEGKFVKGQLSLMLPFTKKWVGHMNTREFEQTNLQKFKCPGMGRMSRLQIDERITESLSLSLSSVH